MSPSVAPETRHTHVAVPHLYGEGEVNSPGRKNVKVKNGFSVRKSRNLVSDQREGVSGVDADEELRGLLV